MTIQADGLYLVLVDIASAVVNLGLGHTILHEGRYQTRRYGKWSQSTNLPKWVTDAGYERYNLSGGMMYIIRAISIPPSLTYEQAVVHSATGAKNLLLELKFTRGKCSI